MDGKDYPLRLEADASPQVSRWLWIFKFILIIPHLILLAFLWIAYFVVGVIAFFAILFTARYPRSLFDFNVGVLRWTWRVGYYSYAANGTDRYPPFTLGDVPDYPAHLDVAYPQRLSRGLVLVKWWLLAIPHLIVVAVFAGGTWYVYQAADAPVPIGGGGLIGILLFISVIILLFTGSYPQSLYDFILGMNRWVLRVAAYVGLMTDRYPPFRLDMGGADPGAAQSHEAVPARPDAAPATGRSGAKVVALIAGCILTMISLGLLFGGGTTLWADRVLRDDDGYLNTPQHRYVTSAGAVTTSSVDFTDVPEVVSSLTLGDVRVQGEAPGGVFVGIGTTAEVDAYLSGVSREIVDDPWRDDTESRAGDAASPPGQQDFWAASASGEGAQTLEWDATAGEWTVVWMNPDGGEGLDVTVRVGATVPALGWIAAGLLITGVVFLLGGVLLIIVGARRAVRPGTAGA